jgi:hypothetical protein
MRNPVGILMLNQTVESSNCVRHNRVVAADVPNAENDGQLDKITIDSSERLLAAENEDEEHNTFHDSDCRSHQFELLTIGFS